MLKMLRYPKENRGFTLIELVVVIAILGVLAVILVPTMMNMVTKARVTSANSTASSIKKLVGNFMTMADAEGYGMKSETVEVLNITVSLPASGGMAVWECSSAHESSFQKLNGTKISWGRGGADSRCSADADTASTESGEKLLCAALANAFPELKKASIVISLKSGSCMFAAFTDEQDTVLDEAEYPALTNGTPAAFFAWDGSTAGISPGGIIIGTAPAIPFAAPSSV